MNDKLTPSEKLARILREGTLGAEWETSQQTMPNDELPFLTAKAVAEQCDLAGFEPAAIPFLQATANRIARDADLMCLAWHCHYLLFHSPSYPRRETRNWPPLIDCLGERTGAFYLLIALSGLPKARAFHRSRGVPEPVARETYSDTLIWAEDYRERHGVWGMDGRILPWLFNHLCGDLYRLGRLQFVQRPFRGKLRAFRHRYNRKVVALSEEGVRYRRDGQLDGTGGEFDPKNGWTSRLIVEANRMIGTPIHPTGVASQREVPLPLENWECILAPSDPILEIHIPAGSPMDFDACGDSFRQAIDFFPRYFPDRPFRGFCCTSWLLNTQFQDWLSPNSNIVRFQREFYLFPIFSSGRSGFERMFGSDIQDLSKAPRDTSLRRAVLDHLQAGGYLRGGGALLFAEDLHWGAQIYQRCSAIVDQE